MNEPTEIWPTELRARPGGTHLAVTFENGESYEMSAEYLRVYSPSAEVRGHGPGQETLQVGKENVRIENIEPIGHYAIKLVFDDGHDSGLYSWEELYRLGQDQDRLWAAYLARLEQAGHKRKTPLNIVGGNDA